MHNVSTNFAKTLVWKHEYDVKLWRYKQRTPNTYGHHIPLSEIPHEIFLRTPLYTRNSSCIALLWLHHNHKMSINYHKIGWVSRHQSVGRWLIFYVFYGKNILTKLVGYRQPTCLCVEMKFVVGNISLSSELYSLSWSCFMWGRHNCVRKQCLVLHVHCCGSCMVNTEYST